VRVGGGEWPRTGPGQTRASTLPYMTNPPVRIGSRRRRDERGTCLLPMPVRDGRSASILGRLELYSSQRKRPQHVPPKPSARFPSWWARGRSRRFAHGAGKMPPWANLQGPFALGVAACGPSCALQIAGTETVAIAGVDAFVPCASTMRIESQPPWPAPAADADADE